jgi:DNA-binding winged helix-turn-helix (wHTH) protein/tetratricopeptide (TPR) repeat protein
VIYAFMEFELDQRLFELRYQGQVLAVQPKVLDVLSYLLRNRDRVVSKQELLDKLWPGEVVSETALTHAVMEARRAVRDDGSQQRIIQTVRRRGYRFVAAVDPRDGEAAAPAEEAAQAGAAHGVELAPDPLVGEVFVGRERPLELLRQSLEDAMLGRGRVALLIGEPGIGKTRTAEVLARGARARGAEVLVGRCMEGEGAPAFWPWVQIVREYVAERDREALAGVMGSRAPVIGQAIPEVREKLPDLDEPPALEPAQARFRLFDSLTAFLKSAAAKRPLVLILDDLHHSDRSSLLLLQFLVRELRAAAMLVLGTYRDTELARDPASSRILGEIVREDPSRPLHLEGLTRAAVADFVERTTGREARESLVTALHEQTGGNPFFLTQVVQLLDAEGRFESDAETSVEVPLSRGVRDAIQRHLDVLSEPCHQALRVASVIGREFPLAAVSAASGLSGEELLEALSEAISARVVSEVPDIVGRYRFSHSLIRETLYGELPTARRVQLHGRIGDALVQAYGADADPHLAELAYHYVQAAPAGRVEEAITYSVRAAEHAERQLAYEQSAAHYERALQVLQLAPQDEPRRLSLLLSLGRALWRAGDGQRARASFLSAADIARSLGNGEALARAALGFGIWDQDDVVDDMLVRLLEDALRVLGEEDRPLRARVMGRLARELRFTAPWERLEQLSQGAVAMARRTQDNASLADALVARHWALWGPANTEDRFAAAVEIVQLAEEIDNKALALQGRQFRLADLLEMGDIPGVDLEIDAISWLADELHWPQHQWFAALFRAMRAHMNGHFEDAETLARKAVGIGERLHRETAVQWYAVQMGALRRQQGRLEEAEAALQIFRKQYPWVPTWRCELALTLTLMGRDAEARSEFEQLAVRRFGDLRLDATWLTAITFLSEVCARLGDTERAATLYGLLRDYAGRTVSAGPGIACYGSAARYLGLLAGALERWDEASAHFEEALEMHGRMGTRPFIAETEADYSRVLLARGRARDRERARELAGRAAAIAEELGMRPLAAEAGALARGSARPRARRTAPRR